MVERQLDVGDEVGGYERFGRTAGDVAANATEVFGGDGKPLGVKCGIVMLAVVGLEERHELVEQPAAALDAGSAPALKTALAAGELLVEAKEVSP